MANNWKESERQRKNTKAIRDKNLKPFSIRNYNFFPCSFSKSLNEGFVCFLQIRNRKGMIELEVNSPRFKSIEEAKQFADDNNVHPYVIG